MNKTILLSSFLSLGLLFSQDEELDLDSMWDNTVWNEIEEVTTKEYEVEKVTTVAGVRGAEAEDEALHHLYYRQSMKGPSEIELNKALGKLLNTLVVLKEKSPENKKIPEVTHYVIQIYKKLDNSAKALELQNELLASAPESKWAKFYK
ncbi:hypothetical protein OAC91_04255 [Candidatus Marinimicrobia bacterium]|jgi:hypothetical protein|nr:hypothetical protein [Candidatus Neomarinimicrobiota bacterium]|tara:strand:+ start:4332 stop:4778 length:447 start_codon:yes stop_codon:yes gene_type:complete